MIRRSHKKSKVGCSECKRRHIKCDENRPKCVNCSTAGIDCSYITDLSHRNGDWSTPSLISLEPASPLGITSSGQPDHGQQHILSNEFINFTHLELFQHCSTNSASFWLQEATKQIGSDIIKYAFSSRFLMYELLAVAAQHLCVIRPERSHFYREEAAKLQSQGLLLFNKDVKEIGPHNIVPAFLFSGLLGVNFFSETFSTTYDTFDQFLDRLVQSFRLLRGVQAIVSSNYEVLRDSELRPLFREDVNERRTDEIAKEFDVLRERLRKSPNLASDEADILDQAIERLIWAYNTQPAPINDRFVKNTRMVTSWPIVIPTEYSDLLAKREPEALIVLAYFAVLLYNAREYWAIREAGPTLLEAISNYLGEQWQEWLAWPKTFISVMS